MGSPDNGSAENGIVVANGKRHLFISRLNQHPQCRMKIETGA